jgi:hypothetical protein
MAEDVLVSRLPPSDCLERLRDAIDLDWKVFGSRPVRGAVGVDGAWLRKRILFRNSFQTVMRIRPSATPDGSILRCRSGMPYFAGAFVIVWFGLLVLIEVSMVLAVVSGRGSLEGSPVVMFGAPLVMMAFGAGLVAVGRWMSRDDRQFLLDFVAQTTEARRA